MASLNIPESTSTVNVSIIDTTLRTQVPVSFFAGPPIPGFDHMRGPAYSFLIAHKDDTGRERKIVFDLGIPVDLENDLPPAVFKQAMALKGDDGIFASTKYVSEILTEAGVDLDSIEAVIWSHAHLDHVGRPSLFPSSTTLIVGPGVKETYFPGWPEVDSAPVLARELAGRDVRELKANEFDLTIGGLKAFDYFGDGSFYFLLAPGHAVGHMNALVRTTNDSFLYLAADSFHHTSQLRPHSGSKLPESISLPTCTCSASALRTIHPASDKSKLPARYQDAFQAPDSDTDGIPFQTIAVHEDGTSLAIDLQAARDTIAAIQKFDASPDVFVIAAHDESLFDVLEYLPAEANGWKSKGWKDHGKWVFLKDFQDAVKSSA